MNLVKELGLDYMKQRFDGCMFYDSQGVPSMVRGVNSDWPRGKVAVRRIVGTVENHVVEEGHLPDAFFKDLSVFQVPPLGWRMSEDGTYMAHLRRNNKSYQRALNVKVLQRTVSPATSFLIETDNVDESLYNSVFPTVAMVMMPKYLQFREGIEKMRKGEVFSFCVNPNLAVIPALKSEQTLLFNTTPVGRVTKDGEVVVDVPQVHTFVKDSIK